MQSYIFMPPFYAFFHILTLGKCYVNTQFQVFIALYKDKKLSENRKAFSIYLMP